MAHDVEIFYEGGLDFAEAPRWHDGRLWLSDFFTRKVQSFDASGDQRVEAELDDQPSGLGWLPSGELLVVAMKARQVRRQDAAGQIHVHADLSTLATGDCNDMVVDGRGNAYVGNFGTHNEERVRIADLVLVRPDGSAQVVASEIAFPNGTVITPDGTTLIVGESMGARYSAFTIADDGTLSDRRVWAPLPGKAPDGCALDADGGIWMADAAGTGCHRVVEGGEITHSVVASQTVFACALGGADRRTLYLLTAPGIPDVSAGQGRGRIEITTVDVPGVGYP